MEATAAPRRDFDHLREHSIGLPSVLFQSITHMAPAAAVAYSIYISVPHAGPALPLAVFLALIACLLAANSIGQLAKELPSAGGLYTYTARSLGPYPASGGSGCSRSPRSCSCSPTATSASPRPPE